MNTEEIKSRLDWYARSGAFLATVGVISYIDAFLSDHFLQTVIGGLCWACAVAQWSLEHMEQSP